MIRQTTLWGLEGASLGRGRRVRVAGRYPLNVPWDRMGIDFETLEAPFIRAFGDALQQPKTVFDVGASIGEWAALAASLVGSAHVHVFEPNGPSWRWIRDIFRRNGLGAPAGMFPGFVSSGDRCAPDEMARAGAGAWPSGVKGPPTFESLERTGDLPMVTLDSYCAHYSLSPEVIKIDVEGAEGEVLRGAVRVLSECRPTVFLSLHPWILGRFGDDKDALLGWMQVQGFACELLSVDHEEHYLCRPF
jgi:FkbM family methyltransferase